MFEHQKKKSIRQNVGTSYLGKGRNEFFSSVFPLMSLCCLLEGTDSILLL